MLNPTPWVVHKFGGSSVADADCFRKVAAILDSVPAARLGVGLSPCRGVTDAVRRLVVVEWGPLGPGIQWAESRANLEALVPAAFSGTVIITGFIASGQRGVQTTLGRNGSDFSASIFGALVGASEIHIWTDVDGVLSV